MRLVGSLAACALLLAPASGGALDWPGRVEAALAAYERASEPSQRAEAIEALAEAEPSAALRVLERALDDSSKEVRAAACTSAGRIGAVELEELIITRLGDRAPEVRTAAALALGELRSEAAQDPLGRLLADRAMEVRVAAVDALTALASSESVIAISSVLNDRSREVVVAALGALGALGQPGSVYAVLEKATDPSEEVSLAAVDALVELRADAATGTLVELMSSGRSSVALASIEGLGLLGAQEGVPALVSEIVSPRVEGGREAAIEALIAIGSTDAVAPLTPLLLSDPTLVGDYFTAIGTPGWDAFREVASHVPIGSELNVGTHVAWLRSADPLAVAALPDGLLPTDAYQRLRFSPTAEAFCAATDVGVPWRSLDLVDLADWAVEAGAVNCLRPVLAARSPLPADQAADIASSLARSAPALALEMIEVHASVDSIAWDTAVPLIESAAALGQDGIGVLESMAFSSDGRVRLEAVAALLDVADRVPDRILAALRDDRTRQTEWVRLLTLGGAGTESLATDLARNRDPLVRSAALLALSETCAGASIASRAVEDDSYWVRRAAYEFGRRCGEVTPRAGEFDPVGARLALADSTLEELSALSGDLTESDYVRIAAVLELSLRGESNRVADLRRARSPMVAASAWLVGGAVDDPVESGMAALAIPNEVERSAVFEVVAADLDAATVEHALRREGTAGVRRVLSRAEPYADGVVVFLVDRFTGYARQDEDVFVVFEDGTFDVFRSDAHGLVTIARDDVRAVFAN